MLNTVIIGPLENRLGAVTLCFRFTLEVFLFCEYSKIPGKTSSLPALKLHKTKHARDAQSFAMAGFAIGNESQIISLIKLYLQKREKLAIERQDSTKLCFNFSTPLPQAQFPYPFQRHNVIMTFMVAYNISPTWIFLK